MTAAFCSWFQTKEQVNEHGWTGAWKQGGTCALSSQHRLTGGRNCHSSLFFSIQHKISAQMSLRCGSCWVFEFSFFYPSFLSIIFLSPFFCPVARTESVIEKQHCWSQLKKSLSSCGVKEPPLPWTLELVPFIQFSPAWSRCPAGTECPADPPAAARNGGSSRLVNLDFLNLPPGWHIDKQPRF